MLVLSTIENYENAQKIASAQGTTVANLAKKKKKQEPQAKVDDDLIVSDADKSIGRGRAQYASWPRKWLQELLAFIAGIPLKAFDKLDKNRMLEAVGFSLDLRCTGKDLDKVSDTKVLKKDLYQRLEVLYHHKGDRLKGFAKKFTDGYCKWDEHGCYTMKIIKTSLETKIALSCRFLDKIVTVEKEVLQDDAGPFELCNNYSLSSAYIQGVSEKYYCQNLFPALSRSLKRSLSDLVLPGDSAAAASGAKKAARTDASAPRAQVSQAPPSSQAAPSAPKNADRTMAAAVETAPPPAGSDSDS